MAEFLVEEYVVEAVRRYATDIAENCAPAAVVVIKEQLCDEANLEFWTGLELAKTRQRLFLTVPEMGRSLRAAREGTGPQFTMPQARVRQQ